MLTVTKIAILLLFTVVVWVAFGPSIDQTFIRLLTPSETVVLSSTDHTENGALVEEHRELEIVTLLGFSVGGALSGAVLTETIFGLNGMGRVAVKSIQYIDLPVIMGVTLITAVIFLLSNLVVDIMYAIVDPRVRLE